MSMSIRTTAIGTLDLGPAVDHHVEAREITPAEIRPVWSLTANFDDSEWAESLGCRPILSPHAA